MTEQQNTNASARTNSDVDFGKNKGGIPSATSVSLLKMSMVVTAIIVIGYLGWNAYDRINVAAIKAEEAMGIVKKAQMQQEQWQNVIQELQNDAQKIKFTKAKYWRPLVIEHLVQLADLTLSTTKDPKLALSFLQAAKQYADDPELSIIRQALNKDIANLQSVPAVDTSELVLKIEELSQKIIFLPLITQQFTTLQKRKSDSDSSAELSRAKTVVQHFLARALSALKDLVIIRRQVTAPLPLPEEEAVLRGEIRIKLVQAELAIMQRQNKLYQRCLEQAINWVTRCFAANQVVTTEVLASLKELQNIDLEPKLPLSIESMVAVKSFYTTDDGKDASNNKKATLPKVVSALEIGAQ